MKDAVEISTVDGVTYRRFAFEEMRIFDAAGRTLYNLQINAHTDIVWTCMLYGRQAKVMAHLGMALVLGHQLRTQLRPALAGMGINFVNVLFVTENSLEEQELQAASFFWSIKVVDLPVVASARLDQLSFNTSWTPLNQNTSS